MNRNKTNAFRQEEEQTAPRSPEELVKQVYRWYNEGLRFHRQINLTETVENNENFFIGKQWEGVKSNGLPTPVFNIIKRIVLFQVASICGDNVRINAAPLSVESLQQRQQAKGAPRDTLLTEQFCNILNNQFEALWERTKSARKLREFLRDAAVRGDGCLYAYYNPEEEEICTELLENTRVFFGNPQEREVQVQPRIIVEKRELVTDMRRQAEENGQDPTKIQPDRDENHNRFHDLSDDKVTVLTCFRRDRETGTIHCSVSTPDALIREEWDTGQTLYPLVWMNWDRVTNCYHGMADVTGLIPNQVFINKMFAMVYLSLMTTAYPKVLYDKTRIRQWDSAVGTAIGVNGGDINTVAKNLEGAAINPQVGEFIRLTIEVTKDVMGATDAALGAGRPDNTSAIIALQKAANVPMELVKQNLYQAMEELAHIWTDLMRCYYGHRNVEVSLPTEDGRLMPNPDSMARQIVPFDFGLLDACPLNIRFDVGGSAYWSEIAQLQTLDNLLQNDKISVTEYVRRLPSGYLNRQTELVQLLEREERSARLQTQLQTRASSQVDRIQNEATAPVTNPGYQALQRKLQLSGQEGG